jgi:ABC-type sugar transport system ATPase subunit
MEIVNLQPKSDKPKFKNANKLAPQWPFRLIVIGKSGSGKTNLVLNLIFKYLKYDTLTVYARHLDNTQYTDLRERVENAEDELGHTFSHFDDSLQKCIPVDDFNEELQNLVLFDDFASLPEKEQQPVVDYFIRGRHKGISSIYISQIYHKIPKGARLQSTMVILFKGSNHNDKQAIWKDHMSQYSFEEFDQIYHACTDEPHSFMVIDLENPELHIRKGFDSIYIHENNKK